MSDLHQAVQARIAAHTPAAAPPFDALKDRKRTRDRRRYAVAGTVLSVGAAGAAALTTGWLDRSGDRLVPPTVAEFAEQPAQQVFAVKPSPRTVGLPNAGEGLRDCLALPGTSGAVELQSDPPQYEVTVTGAREIDAFQACADAVPGYYAERQDRPVAQGYTPPGVEVRVDGPAAAGQPVRIEAVIQDDRDVAVHRVEFGDGTQQVVQFLCGGNSPRPAPDGPQIHAVDHTWVKPGDYTVTFHYGPPCTQATSSVSHNVTISR